MTTVYYVAVLGQSNAASMFNFGNDPDSGATMLANGLSGELQPTSPGTASSTALTSLVNGTGQTARFATASNVVVQNYALGASGVDGNAHGAPPADLTWWYPDTGTPGALSIAAATGMALTLSALRAQYDDVRVVVVWGQGEADAKRIADGYSDVPTYKAATLAVFDYVRTAAGEPDAPVYINEIGVANYQGSEARWDVGQDIVRAAQDDLAAQHDNIYIGAVTQDLPMKDQVHISDDSYEVVGARDANYIAYTQGLTDVITGPRPTPDPDNYVDPTDHLPVSTADFLALSVTDAGNVLANDSDPDNDVLTVRQVAGAGGVKAVYATGATIQGRFGTLLINQDGRYSYVLDNSLAATRAIAGGQIGTDILTYVVNDGRGGMTSSTLSIFVDGQNDAPIAVNDAAVAASSVAAPLIGNVIDGVGADSDPDAGDTISVAAITARSGSASVTSASATLVGAYGVITIQPDGSYSYAIDQGNAVVGALLSGQTLTEHFAYTIVDNGGLSSSASLDIIVQKYPADIAQFGTPTIVGNESANSLSGTVDNDTISGGGGNDTLKGNTGDDVVLGGDGDDSIQGNDGNDTIVGGIGHDIVKGGNGNDIFFFGALADAGDIIQDLRSTDTITVAQILNLAPGTPGLDAFAFGYLQIEQTGADVLLSIDVDGRAGPAGFVTLATLQATTVGAVLASQFVVSAAGTLPPSTSAPVAVNDSFTVNEDSGLSLVGNIVTGAGADVDPNGAELEVIAVNGSTGLVGTWITLSSGVRYEVEADGNVQFDTAGKYESLAFGQSLTQRFTYSIFNDFSTTAVESTATVSITIVGANDAPTVAAPLALSAAAGSAPAALSLLAGAADVDAGDVLSIVNVAGLGDGLSLNGTALTIDPTSPRFALLHVGETQTIALTYDIQDLRGAIVHQMATINIAGTLPVTPLPPVLGAPPTLALLEGAAAASLDLLAGDASADPAAALFVTNLAGLTSGMQLTGSTVNIDPTDPAYNALAAGEVQTINLSFTVVDSHGASANQIALITIQGTNDKPGAAGELQLTATADASVLSFDLLAGATDADHGDVLHIDSVAGLISGLSIADSTFTIDTASAAFQSLADGEASTIDIAYRIVDSQGAAIEQTAHLTVTGLNDTPLVAAPLELHASEGGGVRTLDLLLGASDPDHGATLSVDHIDGLSAGLTVANGILTVDLNNPAFDGLAKGQSQTLEITYAVVDEHGAAVRQTASIVIDGTNDAPTTAGALSASATRGDHSLAIDLLSGASDVDSGATLGIVNLSALPSGFSLNGNSLIVDPSNAAYQNLTAGQSMQKVLSYRISDEYGATTTQQVTVTIVGRGASNTSAPVITTAASQTIAENTSFVAALTATDADNPAIPASFSVTGGSDAGLFVITGGKLLFKNAPPDYERDPHSYQVEISASDGLYSTAELINIAITNVAGVSITGTRLVELIDATHSPAGEPRPGSEEDTLLGAGGNDTLWGLGGDDLLNGGDGADLMNGGVGDDTYYVDNAGDVVVEAASAGNDTVVASLNYALGANVENLLLGTNAWNATGNSLANSIVGNARSNIIDGGAGADIMSGGAGNDVYVVDNDDDKIIELSGQGVDTVNATADSYTLADNVETLDYVGTGRFRGIGNALANSLLGGGGSDTLDGSLGVDTMEGGAGDDTYYVDNARDEIREQANSGRDTVLTTFATYALAANVEILTFIGTGNFTGRGNELANTITGGTGADSIDGRGGADRAIGGAGDDTYFIDDAKDVVIEQRGGGTDTVKAAISYTLADNVEILILTGTGNINATGNADANSLVGNAGNNSLDGGLGVDTMAGGGGNDTYFVRDVGDIVFEKSNEGSDTVLTWLATYELTANIETLTYMGVAKFSGTGNGLANTITGGSGNDTIDGKAGADSMIGGGGDDIYYVDNTGDRVTEAARGGIDAVFSSVSFTLSANVEALALSGTATLAGTGNASANAIIGNSGNNTLDGGGGTDLLTGSRGNDTFIFKAGEANGDAVADFEGAHVRGGDVLQFQGFGRGWITQNGSTDFYTIHGDAGHNFTETIQIIGVYNLDLTAGSNGDVLFI